MEITKSKPRKRNILSEGRNVDSFPHGLQFYSHPPQDIISLQQFEDCAIKRLKVLKAVESVGFKKVKGSKDYEEELRKELKKLREQGIRLPKENVTQEKLSNEEFDCRQLDHYSHFILRLAYCRSEDLRRWFIQQEVDLFKYRFANEYRESIAEFLALNNMNYQPIPDEEKKSILHELKTAGNMSNSTIVEGTDYYKVPFLDAAELVSRRRVFLQKGYAFVPQNDLIVLVSTQFRSQLSHALAATSRALPTLEEDSRLLPMLSGLSKRYLGQDYTNKKQDVGQITAAMIDQLTRKSFPLCMQQLHQTLRKEHHLRHGGRQQYGLFLKGIGLSLEEALRFWKTEFSKKMDSDKFDKQYAYNIRHNYGKEGKRADYTPFSCVKVITSNAPGPGDAHGCPFRHFDVDILRQRLQGMQINKTALDEICESAKKGNPQIACAQFFEASHKQEDTGVCINHPNQYFEESQKLLHGDKPQKAATVVKKVIRVPASQSSQNSQSSVDDFDDTPMSMEEIEMAMSASQECA